MDYIKKEFRFSHLNNARIGDSAHFHMYKLKQDETESRLQLELDTRLSTDADGIAACLGLQTEQKMELEKIVQLLESKLTAKTLFMLQ